MKTLYRICSKCIMDTSDLDITFDERGVCNHCAIYHENERFYVIDEKERQKELERLVQRIKHDCRDKEYDVVVGVSGGVDSSYVAYWAKKLGFRVLAVHFDNGWDSELAVKNIEHIIKKLGFDFQTNVVDWEEFKDIQLSFLRASIANAEIPTDHAFLAALYKICVDYDIQYILSGSNYVTEAVLPKSWGYNAKDLKHLKAIHKRFGTVPIKTYPTLGIAREIYYTYIKKIKMIRLLNYLPYNKAEAMKTLRKELGWIYYGGKHYESRFTKFFQAYILPTKFNIDKRRAHLSTLICSGQITRDEALEQLKEEIYPPDKLKEDKEYVIKKFCISDEEFERIIELPIKSYRDYPNNEAFNQFIYSIYYKFKKK